MAAESSVSMSFRVSQRFTAHLEAAAAIESRSVTNMLETLVFAYCDKLGPKGPVTKARKPKVARHA